MPAWLKLAIVIIAGLGSAGCDVLKPTYSGIDLTGINWGKEFRLADPDGHERTLADYRGRYVMVFFGYVQCPVVCPTALLRAAEARNALGADRERVQVIFITLDPERDTPAIVKEYATAFDPSFVGLRGDLKRTQEAAKEFRVFYEKVPTGGSYSIDHTAMTYIFDDLGRPRLAMQHKHTAEQYVADMRTLMKSKS